MPAHVKPLVHVSPMGLVPKPHQVNKFWLIVDLSHPPGASVNDGISPSICSLRYASVDDAVIIKQLGRGTQLVKLDIKDAYRIIPVHPDDYHFLGVSWRGETYVDRALPFGLRSAPKIFSAVADFISWVLHQQGIDHHLHYLDDFLRLVAPDSDQAKAALDLVLRVFHSLGIPVATHKTDGPATMLGFLGILIDTQLFELRLPTDKLARLQAALHWWTNRKRCTRRELESLLGQLSHAATVIVQGRTFLRPLLSQAGAPHHHVRLTAGARADLLWWKTFLQEWNGVSFFPTVAPSREVVSDALGTYECGAFSHPFGWFQLQWPESWNSVNIAAKELVPVVIAAALWGRHWNRSCICLRCDNMAVVSILKSRTSRDPLAIRLGLQGVDAAVRAFVEQGISDATRAVYKCGWRRYQQFCSEFGLQLLPLTEHIYYIYPLPVCHSALRVSQLGDHPVLPQRLEVPSNQCRPPRSFTGLTT